LQASDSDIGGSDQTDGPPQESRTTHDRRKREANDRPGRIAGGRRLQSSVARYCVDTVGLNSEMIQKYVRFQEKEEHDQQQLDPELGGPSKKGR
jgi:hypothetical protein